MNKSQIAAIDAAVSLFTLLYFGLSTKKHEQAAIDQSRSLNATTVQPKEVFQAAKANLTEAQKAALAELEQKTIESKSIEAKKELAGWWIRNGFPNASGLIAEEIAEEEGSAAAWSIAGATYQILLQDPSPSDERTFAAGQAVSAFEKAISLEPENVEHRVNLALIYADAPPKDNPMQAVLMLRDLEKKHPNAPSVYNALGRLSIKTGQWENAIKRLDQALKIDPKNRNAVCLMAKAYEGKGDTDMAKKFAQDCASL